MVVFRSLGLATTARLAFGGCFASDGFGVASARRSVSAKVLADCAGGVLQLLPTKALRYLTLVNTSEHPPQTSLFTL